jgi:hypothetical protein
MVRNGDLRRGADPAYLDRLQPVSCCAISKASMRISPPTFDRSTREKGAAEISFRNNLRCSINPGNGDRHVRRISRSIAKLTIEI